MLTLAPVWLALAFQEPPAPRPVEESPAEEFQRIGRELYANDNPFIGAGTRRTLEQVLANPALPADRRVEALILLAKEHLKSAEIPRALELLGSALELAAGKAELSLSVHRTFGLAYLRQAEQENCVARHNSQCCIFPLEGGAIHVERTPAEKAREHYSQVLEQAPGDLEALWLLNILAMALGEWLSVQSSRELYQRQIAIEKAEIATAPEEEAEELALIYQARGLDETRARQLSAEIMSDAAGALNTLARDELGIDPEELGGSAWEAAITSFLLFAASDGMLALWTLWALVRTSPSPITTPEPSPHPCPMPTTEAPAPVAIATRTYSQEIVQQQGLTEADRQLRERFVGLSSEERFAATYAQLERRAAHVGVGRDAVHAREGPVHPQEAHVAIEQGEPHRRLQPGGKEIAGGDEALDEPHRHQRRDREDPREADAESMPRTQPRRHPAGHGSARCRTPGSRPSIRSSEIAPPPRVSTNARIEPHPRCSDHAPG